MNTFWFLSSARGMILAPIVLVLVPAFLFAQGSFVYTNNNIYFGPNTVSAYSVDGSGVVTELSGSPYPTGGKGNGENGFMASNRIITCGRFIYVSNAYSGDVSSFSIDSHGGLAGVPGSPFAAGSTTFYGISLANLRCDFLFAANGDAAEIFAFQIQSDGSLAPVSGSPFPVPSQPNSVKISPDGKFLAASLPNLGNGALAMFNIGSDGTLTTVAGSPYPFAANQTPMGVEINFASNFLFVAEWPSTVDVFNITPGGTISLVTGSPFSSPRFNLSAVLSPDDQFLFTSNFMSGVNSFRVATDGTLTSVSGSPFSAGLGTSAGISVNSRGTLLFVSDPSANKFSVLQVGSDGTLALAPGSPILTGQSGGLSSLAAYPPKTSFSLSATPPTVTIGAGEVATYSATVTSLGGTYDSNVALSCSLPSNLTSASCKFSNVNITPGGNSATSKLTVSTTGMSAGLVSTSSWRSTGRRLATWLPVSVLVLGTLVGNMQNRRRIFFCAPAFVLAFLLLHLAACGEGSSSSPIPSHPTPSGTYTIGVSATSGRTTRTNTVTLVVQ